MRFVFVFSLVVGCGSTEKEEPSVVTFAEEEESEQSTTEPETSEPTVEYLEPNSFTLGASHAYVSNAIGMTYISNEPFTGVCILSMLLDGDLICDINWIFDQDSSEPDSQYSSGTIYDDNYGKQQDVWFGYLITSEPILGSGCDRVSPDTLQVLSTMQVGFGHGPMTQEMQTTLENDLPEYWDTLKNVAFTSYVAFAIEGEEWQYGSSNIGFAYSIQNDQTSYDPQELFPQGTELSNVNAPFSDALYLTSPLFAYTIQ